MNHRDLRLINFERMEAWPATLLRARGSASARALRSARWVLRRKADGRYLAALDGSGRLHAMRPSALAHACRRLSPAEIAAHLQRNGHQSRPALMRPHALRETCARLGLDAGYGSRHALRPVPEPSWLELAGFDRWRRPLWLLPEAAAGWRRMRAAAQAEGMRLEALSGYRSHAYQLGIFMRKMAKGQTLSQILAVNTAPGFSEHHSGRALDIGTPGQPPAEESFESTPAFAWLCERAAAFGFHLSYPRDNPHGIVYEPWHWCLRG